MEYNKLATKESVDKTIANLATKNIVGVFVESKEEAFTKIKELIPAGGSLMNGTSVSLEQIGFVEYLKSGTHPWNNMHEGILAEKDPVKQMELREKAQLSEYYLGSVHGLAETGEFIVASNTGSQLPHIVYTSPNLIFVVSTKKIVPTLPDAYNRLMTHVVPLEEDHMMKKYGWHTAVNKIVTFLGEFEGLNRKITMILVNEDLGF